MRSWFSQSDPDQLKTEGVSDGRAITKIQASDPASIGAAVALMNVICKVFAALTLAPTTPSPAVAVGLLQASTTSPEATPVTVHACSAVVFAATLAGLNVTATALISGTLFVTAK
jgi:hypothetical protein